MVRSACLFYTVFRILNIPIVYDLMPHFFCIGVSVGGVTGIISQVISVFGPVTAVRTVRPFGAGLALRHSRRTYISVPIENYVDCVWPGKFLRFHGQLRLSSSTF